MLTNSMYLFVSKVLGYGIRILLPMLLVRILVKEDFGAYNQFFLLEVMIITLFQTGIIQSLFFFVPRDNKNAGAFLINSIIQNTFSFLVIYILVWLYRPTVAAELGMPLVNEFFWHLASYSLLMMFNTTLEIYITAQQRVLAASIYSFLREVLASIATIVAAFVFGTLESVFIALIISRGVSLLLGWAYVQTRLGGLYAENYFDGFWEQARYGLILGAAGMTWTLSFRMHEMAVSRSFDLETYAVYAVGCKQIPVLQFFGQSVAAMALTRFATLEKSADWEGVRKLWETVLGSMYGVGIPVTLFLLLISKPFIVLAFTADYVDAVPIFRLNTISMMALCLNPTLVLRAMDRNAITALTYTGILIVMPFAFYVAMNSYGLIGIMTANLIFNFSGRAISHFFLNRMVPVYLPYIASRKCIWEFYKSSYSKGVGIVGKIYYKR